MNKTPVEQEEIAGRIAAARRELSPDDQERIWGFAQLPGLAAETLPKTGPIVSLAVGPSASVGLAGFTARKALTCVVVVLVGLVGIHLPFVSYTALATGRFGPTNSLLWIPLLVGGAG